MGGGNGDRWWRSVLILRLPVEVGSLSHYFYGFTYIYMPGGCLGFLNHQQYDSLPELTIWTWKMMVGRWFFSLLEKAYFQKWWLVTPCLFSSTQFRVWIRMTLDLNLVWPSTGFLDVPSACFIHRDPCLPKWWYASMDGSEEVPVFFVTLIFLHKTLVVVGLDMISHQNTVSEIPKNTAVSPLMF